jgi:hypothetical protein
LGRLASSTQALNAHKIIEHIRALVLDTGHLSELARHPTQPAHSAIVERLERSEAVLALSLFEIVELADPAFQSIGDVRALLRDVPHVLANPFENVEDEEFAIATVTAVGERRRPPHVFARDTSEWGYHMGPIGGSALDMLDAFAQLEDERAAILAMAERAAQESMMKTQAALIRDPLLPLTLALNRHLQERRRSLPTYGRGKSAAEIIDAVGGKQAFPAYHTHEALVQERLTHQDQKSSRNDVFDEYIAIYAPYAAVTAVDRRTLHRARTARLAAASRMTRDLAEVPAILDRVIAGELPVVPSTF